MYEEPNEEPKNESNDPTLRAKEKADEFRMFAELAAIFEGVRKWGAAILPTLSQEIARECQRTIGKLEKAKLLDLPVVNPESAPSAAELLDYPSTKELSTNDYHIARRPGEVMILRWLQSDEVVAFYERLQAHFDAAMEQYREDQQNTHGWKQDAETIEYLDALSKIELKMEDRYLRPQIREHKLFVLSTQSADEMDIQHLCDYIMGVPAEEVVGATSAPPDDPTERDRAWFFKLFSLRGMKDDVEQMFFFTFMQKSDDSDSW